MGEFAIGQPVSRLEDPRLLRGLGRYVDDLNLPGQAHAHILRSPHAHARIRSIDARAAAAMPGVLGVLTGADCEADGLGRLPCDQKRFGRDGSDMYRPPRPILARDRVRVVGDYVAMVVAETAAIARDAAERIAVEYEPLPAVVSPADAAEEGAPLLWDDCPGNECFFHEDGDAAAVEAAFADAHLVAERRFAISRVTAAPIGPRGCIASTTRRWSATRSTPGSSRRTCSACIWRGRSSGFRRPACESSRPISAAASGSTATSIRRTRWSSGRRGDSGGR